MSISLFEKTTVIIAAVLLLSHPVHADSFTKQLQAHLRDSVITMAVSPDPSLVDRLTMNVRTLWRYYSNRDFSPMWFDAYGLKEEWINFRQTVTEAYQEGLSADDYYSDDLENLLLERISHWDDQGGRDFTKLSHIEILMTDRFLKYASHLAGGRTNPKSTDPEWHAKDKPLAVERELSMLAGEEPLDRLFEGLEPRHTFFKSMRSALKRHYRIRQRGGWPTISPGPLLKRGDRGARIGELRERLIVSQDLQRGLPRDPELFDAALEGAVRRFQMRHGLDPDGLVGGDTLTALNVPVGVRINQILLNMERLRWLPNKLGKKYLFVNVTEYRLHIVEEDRIIETLDVIVGRRDRPTPSLSAQMRYMILNQYWFVPLRIAKEDILPKIQRDPDYLNRQNIRVFRDWSPDAPEIDPASIDWANVTSDNFRFKLRQDPADTNALGKVKFVFPNKFEIFIHDTPARVLFQNTRRDLSSGCIRIDRPLDLVNVLIGSNPRWTPDALSDALGRRQQTAVMLSDPMPVHILYLTAWATEDGTVHFREDIYGRDQHLHAAFAPVASDPPTLLANRSFVRPDLFTMARTSRTKAAYGIAEMATASVPMLYTGPSVNNGVASGLRMFDRRSIQPKRVGREPEHPAQRDQTAGNLDA